MNHRRKHFFNQNYFSKPNKENSYWAGFIAADGSISDKHQSVTIELSTKDFACLSKN